MTAPLGRLLNLREFSGTTAGFGAVRLALPVNLVGKTARRAGVLGGDGEEARSLRELDPDQLSLQMGKVKKGLTGGRPGYIRGVGRLPPEQGVFQLARLGQTVTGGRKGLQRNGLLHHLVLHPAPVLLAETAEEKQATPVVRQAIGNRACRGAQLKK